MLVFPCSLTIVAENLASLQQQVRLKDSEIERLNQELETARQEQHQLQIQLDQVKKKLHEKKLFYNFFYFFVKLNWFWKFSGCPSSTRTPTSPWCDPISVCSTWHSSSKTTVGPTTWSYAWHWIPGKKNNIMLTFFSWNWIDSQRI